MATSPPTLAAHDSRPSTRNNPKAPTLKDCTTCGSTATVEPCSNLIWEETRAAFFLVLGSLTGARCQACNDRWFDNDSLALIEQYRHRYPVANFEIRLAKVGGNHLGMYFPKDLTRVMKLKPGLTGKVTPVSDTAFVVEITKNRHTTDRKETTRIRFKALDDGIGF